MSENTGSAILMKYENEEESRKSVEAQRRSRSAAQIRLKISIIIWLSKLYAIENVAKRKPQ
jgi:hypothetical protein